MVLVCQNNGWAISTPWSIQSASETVAARAEGYGLPGVLVDGNDVLAMYEVTRQARARALAGDGPTLIEALTTRLGAHTTADDPSRYVTPEQMEAARALDPIARFQAWLRATDRWDDEADALAVKWCDGEIDRAVEEFTGGRFQLGVALGYRDVEYQGFQTTRRDRVGRPEELCQLLRQCWGPDAIDFQGAYFRRTGVEVHPKPPKATTATSSTGSPPPSACTVRRWPASASRPSGRAST